MSQIAMMVRTAGDPLALVSTVRREMARLDAGVAVANPRALDRAMEAWLTSRRVLLGTIAAFAAAALALAGIGLYGVISYAVATRRREIGIPLALGAERRAIVRGVVGRALGLVACGTVVGCSASSRPADCSQASCIRSTAAIRWRFSGPG